VIGRIYPGAFVSVVPAGPGYLKIALPAFPAASAARNQIVAVVEASALGTAPQPLRGPSQEGRLVRDFVMNSPLWAAEVESDSTPPFASTLCGDVRVLSLGTLRSRVSQYHAGVEIIGWYDYLIDADNYCPLHRCNQRYVVQDGASLTLTGAGTTPTTKSIGSCQKKRARLPPMPHPARWALLQRVFRGASIWIASVSYTSDSWRAAGNHGR